MNVFSEREVRKLCKDLEWEEVVLVLLSVLDGVNGEIYDDFKMSIEVYKNDKKKKEVKETQLWIYEIFNNNKIIEKIEQWTKEAEEAGMTLAEYLETINPLNKAGKRGKRMNTPYLTCYYCPHRWWCMEHGYKCKKEESEEEE